MHCILCFALFLLGTISNLLCAVHTGATVGADDDTTDGEFAFPFNLSLCLSICLLVSYIYFLFSTLSPI